MSNLIGIFGLEDYDVLFGQNILFTYDAIGVSQVDEFSPVLLFTPPIKIEFLLCTYVTRIIPSLYYSPASRCINSSSSSESADRGRSIIQVMYVRGYLQGSENGRVVTITIHRSYF
jgi:hypothetical protein